MSEQPSSPAPVHRLVGRIEGHLSDGAYLSKADDAIWSLLDRICVTESSREEAFNLIIEYIVDLRCALQSASDWLPYHEPNHPEYMGLQSDIGRRVRLALNPTCGCTVFPSNPQDQPAGASDARQSH